MNWRISSVLISVMIGTTVSALGDADRALQHLDAVMDQYHSEFFVYSDHVAGGNHGYPSGWMGSVSSLQYEDCWTNSIFAGRSCIRVQFTPGYHGAWSGVIFQSVENNWGSVLGGGIDLSGATKLTFVARGENGGEKVEFFVGSVEGSHGDSFPKRTLGYITLDATWREYEIDLTGLDLSHVVGLFGFVLNAPNSPDGATFYIDEVCYDLPRLDAPRFLNSYVMTAAVEPDQYLHNACFVYDQALALLAYLFRGTQDDLTRAGLVADALVFAMDNDRFYTDGRLRNAYMSGDLVDPITGKARIPGWMDPVSNTWYEDEYQVSSYSGNLAWVMIALLSQHAEVGGLQYLNAAIALGNWIETHTRDERGSGGYTGGYHGWEPSPEKLMWKSVEHNIDIYVAFERLYEATQDNVWHARASHAKQFVESMWNAQDSHFWTGTLKDGATVNTNTIPLDVQAWAVLALNAYYPAVDWAEQHCGCSSDGFSGFDFDTDLDGVWPEGMGQLSLAHAIAGQGQRALDVLFELGRIQALATNGNGLGLVAATHDSLSTGFDWEYFNRLHVGATAWYAFSNTSSNQCYNPYWHSKFDILRWEDQTDAVIPGSDTNILGMGIGLTRFDSIQAVYEPVGNRIHVAQTRTDGVNNRRELWVKSVGSEGIRSWFVGYCYYARSAACPISIATHPATGDPAVAYRDEQSALAFTQFANDKWNSEIVTSVGWHASLGFHPSDHYPAIAFHVVEGPDWNLWYASKASGTWTSFRRSWADACFESLKFHPVTGNPCIAYKTLGWSPGHASRLLYEGSSGTAHVDGAPEYVGGGASLAFGTAGSPHISHIDHSGDYLKLASWTGTTWTNRVIDEGFDGEITSLALSGNDEIFVSYASSFGTTKTLKFVTSTDGLTWAVQTLAQSADLSPWSSVVVDSSNTPYVAYIADGAAWLASLQGEEIQEEDGTTDGDLNSFIMNSGVNLPWIHYGHDIGASPYGAHDGFASNRSALEEDFAFLRTNGVKVCRVFLFCDFRTGLEYDINGNILGVDEYVYGDMQTLVEVAASNLIHLIAVLMDHTLADGIEMEEGNQVGEHPDFITNTVRRAQLIDNVIRPFVREFGMTDGIEWDVWNEPRLASAVSQADVRLFLEACAAAIASETSDARVCFGSYDRYHLDDYGNAACNRTQIHFYEHMTYWDFDTPAAEIYGGDVFFGEASPTNVAYKLGTAVSNGYSGVLFWSLNGNDGYPFREVADEYREWIHSVFSHVNRDLTIVDMEVGESPCLTVAPTYPQNRYRLDCSTDFTEGRWITVGETVGSAVGDSTVIPVGDTEPDVPRFFRVVAEL